MQLNCARTCIGRVKKANSPRNSKLFLLISQIPFFCANPKIHREMQKTEELLKNLKEYTTSLGFQSLLQKQHKWSLWGTVGHGLMGSWDSTESLATHSFTYCPVLSSGADSGPRHLHPVFKHLLLDFSFLPVCSLGGMSDSPRNCFLQQTLKTWRSAGSWLWSSPTRRRNQQCTHALKLTDC